MDDIAANVIMNEREGLLKSPAPVLRAGLDYGFWIRDTAINTWNGTGLLLHDVTRNSMLPPIQL
jgi:hypothetical protein